MIFNTQQSNTRPITRPITRNISRALFTALAAATTSFAAIAAPAYSEWGSVVALEGGWTANTMSLHHSAPLANPDGCPVTNAGYATNPNDSGKNLFHTMMLSAFLNRKEMAVLVSGCVYGKPHIIAVSVR